MLTEDQLAVRASGIGASEIAAALGLSPYVTPLELYRRKRGEAGPQEDSLPMRFGNAVEPFILSEFQRSHPDMHLVIAPDTMRRGALLAHLDALVPERCNVQAKTARSRNGWGESGSSDVPQAYFIQVQAEMLLADVSVSFIPVLFGGADYDEFIVEADAELQDMIESGARDFWARVLRGDPPEPVTEAETRQRWPRHAAGAARIVGPEIAQAVAELADVKRRLAELEEEEQALRDRVTVAFEDAEAITNAGRVLATWKANKDSQRTDWKALVQYHWPSAVADLAEQFTTTTRGARVLRLNTKEQ